LNLRARENRFLNFEKSVVVFRTERGSASRSTVNYQNIVAYSYASITNAAAGRRPALCAPFAKLGHKREVGWFDKTEMLRKLESSPHSTVRKSQMFSQFFTKEMRAAFKYLRSGLAAKN
jgi:hypothetical protein